MESTRSVSSPRPTWRRIVRPRGPPPARTAPVQSIGDASRKISQCHTSRLPWVSDVGVSRITTSVANGEASASAVHIQDDRRR